MRSLNFQKRLYNTWKIFTLVLPATRVYYLFVGEYRKINLVFNGERRTPGCLAYICRSILFCPYRSECSSELSL